MVFAIFSVTILKAQNGKDDGAFVDPSIFARPEWRYDKIDLKWHDGYIVLKEGDTLTGQINLKPDRRGHDFYTTIQGRKIVSAEIERIVFYASDLEFSNLRVTEISRMKPGSDRFYRKIIGGSIEIYDDWLLADDDPGRVSFEEMLILKDGQLIEVWNFWATSDKRRLIRLVNDLLGFKLTYRQFKNKYDVLRWLKENC